MIRVPDPFHWIRQTAGSEGHGGESAGSNEADNTLQGLGTGPCGGLFLFLEI